MVLVSLLLEQGYSPEIVHCNFQLRGVESDEDNEFVAKFASSNKLILHTRRFETREYAISHKLSTQIAARDLRYMYFEELLAKRVASFLFLGHHADDSLETIFINISRGSGLMPLSGIAPKREAYLRPLWLTTKKEIIQYAVEKKISWREDRSNEDDNYQRNYIRHHLIGPLKEAFPDFDKRFSSTLTRTNSDRRLFNSLIQERLNKLLIVTDQEERFPLSHLKNFPEEFSLLYHWLKDKGKFDFDALEEALKSYESGKIFESNYGRLLLDREYLIYRNNSTESLDEYLIDTGLESLETPLKMDFKLSKGNDYPKERNPNLASLDHSKLEFPLKLRHWKQGDRFIPLGMKGSKKLSDFLIDEKLDRFEKEDVWLLCSGDNICWVVGNRVDDRYKITDKTKNTYFAQVITSNENK